MLLPEKSKIVRIDDSTNRFWEDLIKNLLIMINNSKISICSVSGELNSKVYNNESILQAFDRAQRRGVNISVISSNTIDRRSSRFIEEVFNNKYHLYATENREELHFRIFDNKNAFVEKKHIALQVEDREGVFIYNSQLVKRDLATKFDSLRDRSTKIDRENFNRYIKYIQPIN